MLDIGADKGRREVAACGETVDHGRSGAQQQVEPGAHSLRVSSASLRAVTSVHEPTISTGLPSASRTICCRSSTQK